jgi:formate/nitrite transporter FocA (FNT family)
MKFRLKEDWFGYFLSGIFAGIAFSMVVILYPSPTNVSVSISTFLELSASFILSLVMFIVACAYKVGKKP